MLIFQRLITQNLKRSVLLIFASISYGDNLKPFLIQTPKLKCLTSIEDMKDKKNKYLEVEVPKGKFDMYDLFLSLDDQNIKTTVKNEEWFKRSTLGSD